MWYLPQVHRLPWLSSEREEHVGYQQVLILRPPVSKARGQGWGDLAPVFTGLHRLHIWQRISCLKLHHVPSVKWGVENQNIAQTWKKKLSNNFFVPSNGLYFSKCFHVIQRSSLQSPPVVLVLGRTQYQGTLGTQEVVEASQPGGGSKGIYA